MKFGKTIKKIVALGTTATMLGATLGASVFAAGDLAKYPEPFVKDGKFTGLLVVGDKAAAEDVIGVSDIAVSLQFAATKKVGTSTSSVSTTGDIWRVGTSSKKLEMTENVGGAGVNGENLRNITTSIDEDELKALADGSVTTEKGTAGYNQYINFDNQIISGSGGSGVAKFLENDDDVASDFFYIKSGEVIARYSLEFKTSLKSDVEDSGGSKTTTGLYLGDYEDEKITILGTDFTIVKARRVTTAGDGVELTLMGGAAKDTLEEGETKSYTLGGKPYEVTVTAITDTGTIYAKFSVNGESTRSLVDGETATLSDGIQIGVTDIIPNEAGDVTADLVEFYLGADKLFLKDTNVSVAGGSDSLEVGSEDIDDAAVVITGADDDSTFSLDTIQVNLTADDDYYIAPGKKLSEYMEEPQGLIGGWDILYEGLDPGVALETIRVKTSGSDQYDLVFTDGDGQSATVPIAYTSGGTNIKLGDSDDDLVINESMIINKNDYLIVTDGGQENGNRKTYALRYKGADKVASGETATVKFDNLGTGKRIEKTYTSTSSGADAEIKLGGVTFGVSAATDETVNDFSVSVDLNGNGAFNNSDLVTINTDAGLAIAITNGSNTSAGNNAVLLNFSTPDANDYDNVVPTVVTANLTAASGEVAMATPSAAANINTNNITFVSPSSENNIKYAYTSMGAKIKQESPTSDPGLLTIWYPKEQRLPLVYITTKGGSVSKGTGEAVESVTINRIDVGATKLASEVADVKAQNLILVGGPCANAASSEAKGSAADCAAGYEAGKGLIELVDTGAGNYALVVAGYSAADTRAATAVIANYDDYKGSLKGAKVEVVTATSTVKEVTAAAPVAAAAAPAAAPAATTTTA